MTEMTISEPASKLGSTIDPIHENGDVKEQNLIYQENKQLLQSNLIMPSDRPSIKASELSSVQNHTSCNITSSNSINI